MVRHELFFTSEVIFMVFVSIDVAKDKHDLFAVDSGGVVYNMVAPCIVYIFYHLVAVCVYRGIIA